MFLLGLFIALRFVGCRSLSERLAVGDAIKACVKEQLLGVAKRMVRHAVHARWLALSFFHSFSLCFSSSPSVVDYCVGA